MITGNGHAASLELKRHASRNGSCSSTRRGQRRTPTLWPWTAPRSSASAFTSVRCAASLTSRRCPDWWKGDLHKVLTELEREIDKARTRLAAVLDVVGKAIDGSEPVMDAVRKVVTIFQDAKASERKKAKLAAPIEPKQIEPPKPDQIEPPKLKKLAVAQPKPKKNGFEKPIDDEIPF